MTLRFWRGWSIGLRMAFITMLPVVLLFSAFVWYSWYAHRAQVDEELAERGRILARALAETSEYNVISGNLSDLRLTIIKDGDHRLSRASDIALVIRAVEDVIDQL